MSIALNRLAYTEPVVFVDSGGSTIVRKDLGNDTGGVQMMIANPQGSGGRNLLLLKNIRGGSNSRRPNTIAKRNFGHCEALCSRTDVSLSVLILKVVYIQAAEFPKILSKKDFRFEMDHRGSK